MEKEIFFLSWHEYVLYNLLSPYLKKIVFLTVFEGAFGIHGQLKSH
jgi:hypothetical protein